MRRYCSASQAPSSEKRISGSCAHLFQQAIEIAVLQFLDFGLVVGEADIEVGVRHDIDREFALRREPRDAFRGLAVEVELSVGGRSGGELRHLELESLLAEACRRQSSAILCARERQVQRSAENRPAGATVTATSSRNTPFWLVKK